jgi:PleD family two-component response regulator
MIPSPSLNLARRGTIAPQAGMLRPMDLFTRYGGESCVDVSTGCDRAAASSLAERLDTAAAILGLPHPRSGMPPHLTETLGATAWRWPRA